MGIFQASNDGVDYAKALKQIEKHIEENKGKSDQIDSKAQAKKSSEGDGENENISDNEELYNQTIDDQGNTVESGQKENLQKCSEYEREYNEVI